MTRRIEKTETVKPIREAGGVGSPIASGTSSPGWMQPTGNNVVFRSVLPQFAPQKHGILPPCDARYGVFALTFLWLALYAVVVARAGDFVRGSHGQPVSGGMVVWLSTAWASGLPPRGVNA